MEIWWLIALLALGYVWWNDVRSLQRRVTELERAQALLRAQTGGQRTADKAADAWPAEVDTHPMPLTPEPLTPEPPTAEPFQRVPRPIVPTSAHAATVRAPAAASAATLEAASSGRERKSSPEASGAATGLFEYLRKNLFATGGIALLMIGFAIMFRSIAWGELLSPAAKSGLTVMAGVALAGAGWLLGSRNRLWGQMAQGGGAALAYLGVYAATQIYTIMNDQTGLALMALVSLALVARALVEDSKVLAAVGFLGAYATPLLALQGNGGLLFNLGYGLVITAFALWVSARERWLEIAVHAHLCAAGLAGFTHLAARDPLPLLTQQGLLHAYAGLFLLWALAWVHRHWGSALQGGALPAQASRESAVLVSCLGLAFLVYLALESWLLSPRAFGWASLGAMAVGLAMAWAHRRVTVLWSSLTLLASLCLVAFFARSGLPEAVAGVGLFAQGVLMGLMAGPTSVVRAWLARALVLAGAIVLWQQGLAWSCGLTLLTGFVLALRHGTGLRSTDGWLYAGVTAVASVLMVPLWTAAGHLPTTATLLNTVVLHQALLALALGFVLLPGFNRWPEVREQTAAPLTAVLGGLVALGWLLVQVEGVVRPMPLVILVLVLPVLGGFGALRMLSQRNPDWAARSGVAVVQALCTLLVLHLPALLLFHFGQPALLTLVAVSLAWLTFGWLQVHMKLQAFWHGDGVGTAVIDAERAVLVSLGAMVLASVLVRPGQGGLASLCAVLSALGLVCFVRWGTRLPRLMRWLVASASFVVLAYVWGHSVAQGGAVGWPAAMGAASLPVVLTALAVAFVFRSSRDGDRLVWQAAAGLCVLALLKLLASVGSAGLSAIGLAGGLLAIGVLFLLAGYLAPLPPADERDAGEASAPGGGAGIRQV